MRLVIKEEMETLILFQVVDMVRFKNKVKRREISFFWGADWVLN